MKTICLVAFVLLFSVFAMAADSGSIAAPASENVKCVFTGSTITQSCYSDSTTATCSGINDCKIQVSGAFGKTITWKSTCGSVAYTTIDNQDETATFDCATPAREKVTCAFKNSTTEQKCYTVSNNTTATTTSTTPFFSCISTPSRSGENSCAVEVSGTKGLTLSWQSSCRGDQYSTIDGIDNLLTFDCTSTRPQCTTDADCPEYSCPGGGFIHAVCSEGKCVTKARCPPVQACTSEYNPVCASVQVQCVKAPCDPVRKTFNNKCEAERAGAKILYDGKCQETRSCAVYPVPACKENETLVTLNDESGCPYQVCTATERPASYRYAYFTCSNGESYKEGSDSSCKTYAAWKEIARARCEAMTPACPAPTTEPNTTSTASSASGGGSSSTTASTETSTSSGGSGGTTANPGSTSTTASSTSTSSTNAATAAASSSSTCAAIYLTDLKVDERCDAVCTCPTLHAPVCGVNGVTYSNKCAAGCAGIGIAYDGACGERGVKEQVKCIFNNSTQVQKCYASDFGAGCATERNNLETCIADITGPKGKEVTWKSTCGGYAYTTLDGQNEYAKFDCQQQDCDTSSGPVCGATTICSTCPIIANTTTASSNCNTTCAITQTTYRSLCDLRNAGAGFLNYGECRDRQQENKVYLNESFGMKEGDTTTVLDAQRNSAEARSPKTAMKITLRGIGIPACESAASTESASTTSAASGGSSTNTATSPSVSTSTPVPVCDSRPMAKIAIALPDSYQEAPVEVTTNGTSSSTRAIQSIEIAVLRAGEEKTIGNYSIKLTDISREKAVFIVDKLNSTQIVKEVFLDQKFRLMPRQIAYVTGEGMYLGLKDIIQEKCVSSANKKCVRGASYAVFSVWKDNQVKDIAENSSTLTYRLAPGGVISLFGLNISLLDASSDTAVFMISKDNSSIQNVHIGDSFKVTKEISARVLEANMRIDLLRIILSAGKDCPVSSGGAPTCTSNAGDPRVQLSISNYALTKDATGKITSVVKNPEVITSAVAKEAIPVQTTAVNPNPITGNFVESAATNTIKVKPEIAPVPPAPFEIIELGIGESVTINEVVLKVLAIDSGLNSAELIVEKKGAGAEFVLNIKKGWNLFSIPGDLRVKNTANCETSKFSLFEYDKAQNKFVTAKEPGAGKAYWLNNKGNPCTVSAELGETYPISKVEKLTPGWNFVPVLKEMIGSTPKRLAAPCEPKAVFTYLAADKKWINVTDQTIAQNDLGSAMIIYATKECVLAGSTSVEDTIPQLPFID